MKYLLYSICQYFMRYFDYLHNFHLFIFLLFNTFEMKVVLFIFLVRYLTFSIHFDSSQKFGFCNLIYEILFIFKDFIFYL